MLVEQLSNALCGQNRFAEATAMLEEKRRILAADDGALEGNLLHLDALRGAVLARSGNPRAALPILEALAIEDPQERAFHELGSTQDVTA
jgi:hypothetical protein